MMKRTVPLIITTTVGFILIVAYFIPMTQWLGEFAAISFDILAAIAFILGGGNLLKTHLKKISDRQAGWGYSGVTIASFLVMLTIGLGKLGVPPATKQEYFGESFAPLSLDEFPDSQVASVPAALPRKADGAKPAPSVRRQIKQQDGRIAFRGWMRQNQKQDLLAFQDELEWQCAVEQLFQAAQPPPSLAGRIAYYADLRTLSFRGVMQEEQEQALLAMSDRDAWTLAVEQIARQSRKAASVSVDKLPDGVAIPPELSAVVSFDANSKQLRMIGPMSVAQREGLANAFPLAKPFSASGRREFLQEIESLGAPLNIAQREVFDNSLEATWTADQLKAVLNNAGRSQVVSKTACEMFSEMQAGETDIIPTRVVGTDVALNDQQEALLEQFSVDPDVTLRELSDQLIAAGEFTDVQQAALNTFAANIPSVGQRNRSLCLALLRAGPLTMQQRNQLLAPTRQEIAWQRNVFELFHKAHTVKYPWSGDHGGQGTAFWWMYEHVFKPLTATMFSMLAFYVASAAFRAFRAKNFEAILLLGTAFLILLGRTFAGVWLTSWLPDSVAGLRIENLSVFVMSVFNTAGNRAIMVGIALGIASTSLKVLLGIDRSYLSQQED